MTITDLLEERLSTLNWSQTRVSFISHFLVGLIRLNTVNLTKLANHFESSSKVESNYKRLQRFFRHFEMDFSALAHLIAKWLPEEPWVLCLDRTNWKIGQTNINILVLAVAYKGIAVPLLWCLLDKQGCSNTQERIDLMNRFLALFGVNKIAYLTADREFKGKQWVAYLQEKHIPFRIRIANNSQVSNRFNNRFLSVTRLFPLQLGEVMILNKARYVWGAKVFLGATRTNEGYVIIISSEHTQNMLQDYARRWEIETLFGCLKTRGFNLEQTRMREPERLAKLFALLTVAFIWSYRMGQWLIEKKPIRKLKHGRLAHSVFRHGLDYLSRLMMLPMLFIQDELVSAFQLLEVNDKLVL